MESYSSKQPIKTYCNLPHVMTCSGRNFLETRRLSLSELSLFIERDVRILFSQFPSFEIGDIKCRVDKVVPNHILIAFSATKSAHDTLTTEVEKILWSYNHQTMLQRNGRLVALEPRFTYQIGAQNPSDVIPLARRSRHA